MLNTTRSITLIIIFLLLQNMIACSDNNQPKPNSASVVENTYKNTFFNFQIDLPKNWHLASQETMDEISNEIGRAHV